VGTVLILGALLFLRWYANTVRTLSGVVDKSSKKLSRKYDNQYKPRQIDSTEMKFTNTATTAPATVQLGDLVVGIASAEMGPLPLQNGRNSPDALSFKLRITNLSKQPLHYESWSGSSGVIVLKDQGNNFYNRVDFGPEEMPNGSFPRGDI